MLDSLKVLASLPIARLYLEPFVLSPGPKYFLQFSHGFNQLLLAYFFKGNEVQFAIRIVPEDSLDI